MGANAYEKRAAHCNNKSFLPIFHLPSNERWRMGNKKRKRDEKSGKMRINFYELSYDRKNRVLIVDVAVFALIFLTSFLFSLCCCTYTEQKSQQIVWWCAQQETVAYSMVYDGV